MLSSLSYPAQQMDNNISRRRRQQLAKTIDQPLNVFQERSKDSFLYSLSSVRRRSELVKTINCVKLIFNLVLNTNGSFTNSAPSPLIALFWKPEEIRRLQHCQLLSSPCHDKIQLQHQIIRDWMRQVCCNVSPFCKVSEKLDALFLFQLQHCTSLLVFQLNAHFQHRNTR